MAEAKKNYKTLFCKHGRMWFKDESGASDRVGIPLEATYITIEEAFRSRVVSSRNARRPSYVPYEDFEDLKIQFKRLEQEIEQIKKVYSSKEMHIAINDALSQLEKITGIEEIQNYSENGNLTLLVAVKDFSANLFRKIANVEINLARKYIDLCVDVRPIINDEGGKKKTSCE
jgi:hypothetical protein